MLDASDYSVFDPHALERTLGMSDINVLIDFFDVFLSFTGNSWAELEQASSLGNLEKVRHIAHSLKSSSHSIGAIRLSREFSNLEEIAASGDASRCIAATAQVAEVFRVTLSEIKNHSAQLEVQA